MGISFVTLILNSSFQIMGVDLSEFKSLFLSFLPLFIKDYIQTLLANGILFGAIGLLLSSPWFVRGSQEKSQESEVQNQSEFQDQTKKTMQNGKTERSSRKEFWSFGVFIFLLWCHSIISHPQIYGEFFFYRFPFLRFFLFFLTDWIRPEIPQTIALAILGISIVSYFVFLIADRAWSGAVCFFFFCFFSFYFHSLGNAIGIFIVTLVYLATIVFDLKLILGLAGVVLTIVIRNRLRFLFLFFVFCFSLICFHSFGNNPFGIFDKKKEGQTNFDFIPVTKKNPNILILSADSLRYDKMGYSQGKKGLTPHIDSLSKDSVIFQDHHTTIPRTFPAWADLLTGRLSFVHGIQDMFPDARDRSGLNRDGSETLPKLFSRLGYRTNVVSSFAGDIFPRADWGFQSVKAPIFHAGTLTAQRILETQIFLLPIITDSLPGSGEYFSSIRGLPSLGEDSKILPDLFEDVKESSNPFFTVFFSSVTHFPFSPPYPFYKKFTKTEYYGKFKYFKFVDPSDSSELSQADREQIRDLFQAGIASFDDSVGKIVERLKEKEIYDSTLIVLTSDHGESLFEADHSHGHGEHLRGEGVTHIPLLIKFPKSEGAGKKFSGISSSLDLFPTLLLFVLKNIADSPLKESLLEGLKNRSGRNLFSAVDSNSWKDDRFVYGETGIWFSDRGDHFFQKERIFYPNILRLHSIESGKIPFISIGDSYAKESVIVSKHRMLQNGTYKLIYIPSEDGVFWRCYDRIRDPWNTKPLPVSECGSLKESLNSFLIRSGKFKKAGEYLFPLSN